MPLTLAIVRSQALPIRGETHETYFPRVRFLRQAGNPV
jgi:hypothetical protein